MGVKITKTAIFLAFCFFILTGCQQVVDPLADVVDNVTGKVQVEQKKQADRALAIIKCKNLCQQQLSTDGEDFDIGPCLSNEIVPDWVCDIAHSPRQDVDNDPANQCSAFRQGNAHHFVELDGNCDTIKIY
jgi:hypothetical protein